MIKQLFPQKQSFPRRRESSHQPGYVIPVTLIFISAIVAIAGLLYAMSAIYTPYQHIMIEQEKARQLALGGIHIGMSSLSQPCQKKEKKETGQQQKEGPAAQEKEEALFLARLITGFDRWQLFTFTKERDGIAGEIKICITCEDGKVNLNEIYDFKKHQFTNKAGGQWKLFVTELMKRIQTKMGGHNLFNALENFLKKRSDPLNDVTDLFAIKEFELFKNNLFYEPEQEKKQKPLFLADLFTVHTNQPMLDPWLISYSMLATFDLSRNAVAGKDPLALVNDLLKGFKKTSSLKEWWEKFLSKIYGKGLQSLPKTIESVLSTTFEPKNFCIMSHGSFGSVTQRVVAIVERQPVAAGTGKTSSECYDVSIKRLYWV